MAVALIAAIFLAPGLQPPKRPDLREQWRVVNYRRANEIQLKKIWVRDVPRWVRLYGVDVPDAGQTGFSGARQRLELLLDFNPLIFVEDETKGKPVIRNAQYVEYVWEGGNLVQFEMVRDGWAKVNQDGRKGHYGKFLVGAEDEAKRFKVGIWAVPDK